MSSIRHGPITRQYPDWKRIGDRLTSHSRAQREQHQDNAYGKKDTRVLIICGMTDSIIRYDELVQDATQFLGSQNFEVAVCEAGHELPITCSKEIVDRIWKFWESRETPSNSLTFLA